jgi:6-phosphogluconolactonase
MKLRGNLVVSPDLDSLYDRLGSLFLQVIGRATERRGVFHLALSGGSTPEAFYIRLATDPRYRAVEWSLGHLWVVDERRVPGDDARCNFRMIQEALAGHVPIRPRNVHPMRAMESDPAGLYEAELRDAFDLTPDPQHEPPRMDLVLLGMGDDGHTASLFPHSKALAVRDRWVAVNDGPGVTPPDRVTLTYPTLNAARQVAVLVTGAKKAAALRRVSEAMERGGDGAVQSLPILGIDPESQGGGGLTWFVDSAAAGSGSGAAGG